VSRVIPSHLRRRWLSTWLRLVIRTLAAAGLLLAALLAGTAHNGPLCLAFLTATALVGMAAARALGDAREATDALRLHRAVKDVLEALARGGWHLKHDLRWPGGKGDGHLAMIPSGGLAFAVKDCSTAIEDFDLSQTQDFATALSETGRPYVPICVAMADEMDSHANRGVVCCTSKQLASELREAEEAFAAGLADESTRRELLYG
jgi:hypothetical protein